MSPISVKKKNYNVGGDWLGQHSVCTAFAAIWAVAKMRRANQSVVGR